jgi:rubrerythrin
MRKLWFLAVACLLAAPLFASTSKSLDNLQTAYNGESNAHARYLEFAGKADQEGYGSVASLFRAAARAEQIHAENHAVVIRKLGGTPEAKIDQVTVKSTAENLEVAIKGETYERDVMYPDFIKQARAERNTDALQTFNYAKSAETEHARLYTEAHGGLNELKGKTATYYVCTICGFTTTKIDFEKCPSCFNPKDKYVSVS